MKALRIGSVVAGMSFSILGCGNDVPENVTPLGQVTARSVASSAVSAPSGAAFRGFVHGFSNSRFLPGAGAVQKSEAGFAKLVGPDGTFATDPRTGFVVAIANASSIARTKARLPGGPSEHNAFVRSYFVGAGLPNEQIASVNVNSRMTATGFGVPAQGLPPAGTLLFYYSIVKRKYGGVPVPDSFAWAHVNVDGEVVSESVYWPEIPAGVLADADAFAAVLNDVGQRATFNGKLPAEFRDRSGELVIRHTPGPWTGAFEAVASFDVVHIGQKRMKHFAKDGTEIVLSSERSLPPQGVDAPNAKVSGIVTQ